MAFSACPVQTITTTETYTDHRAKEAARHGTLKSPPRDSLEEVEYVACYYEATPYGQYTAEVVTTSATCTDSAPENPGKRKFSDVFSAFMRRDGEKKQPAQLADATPVPSGPVDSSKGFFPKLRRSRPPFLRRHAYWRGKSPEESGNGVVVDAMMTGTEDLAATSAPVAPVEGQSQPERASMAQRRLLDMIEAPEERPQKRARVVSAFVEDFVVLEKHQQDMLKGKAKEENL